MHLDLIVDIIRNLYLWCFTNLFLQAFKDDIQELPELSRYRLVFYRVVALSRCRVVALSTCVLSRCRVIALSTCVLSRCRVVALSRCAQVDNAITR